MKREERTFGPYVALVTASVLWGSSFMAMRRLVTTVEPAAIVWLRSIIALTAVLPFRRIWRTGAYRKGDLPRLAILALLQPCLYFLLEANALRFTTATQAGVVSAVVPVLVTLGAALFLREGLRAASAAGILLSIAGVAALSFAGTGDGLAANAPLGNLMELGAMVCAAANLILIKGLSDRYGPWTIAAYQAAAGSLFFLPAAPKALAFLASAPGPLPLLSVLYLGAGVTLGAFGLYNVGQRSVSAGRAAAFINLVPLLAALFGWVLLGESLNALQIAAAAAIVLGVRIGQAGSAAAGGKGGKTADRQPEEAA